MGVCEVLALYSLVSELVNSGTKFIFHQLSRVKSMSKGIVKWFNADKGFGFICLYTIQKSKLAAVTQL